MNCTSLSIKKEYALDILSFVSNLSFEVRIMNRFQKQASELHDIYERKVALKQTGRDLHVKNSLGIPTINDDECISIIEEIGIQTKKKEMVLILC